MRQNLNKFEYEGKVRNSVKGGGMIIGELNKKEKK